MRSGRSGPGNLMTVVFGTLGFTPKKLLPSVTSHEDVRKLVYYHDHHKRSVAASKEVRAYCREVGIQAVPREIDAFDIVECARAMRRDVRGERREAVVFNVTGGTPVLSCAATLVAILEGVRAEYVDERTWSTRGLPLLALDYASVLNDEQRRVLQFVARRGTCAQVDVSDGLGLSRGTVSHHVANLKAKRLLVGERDERDHRKENLRIRESAVLLLEDVD